MHGVIKRGMPIHFSQQLQSVSAVLAENSKWSINNSLNVNNESSPSCVAVTIWNLQFSTAFK